MDFVIYVFYSSCYMWVCLVCVLLDQTQAQCHWELSVVLRDSSSHVCVSVSGCVWRQCNHVRCRCFWGTGLEAWVRAELGIQPCMNYSILCAATVFFCLFSHTHFHPFVFPLDGFWFIFLFWDAISVNWVLLACRSGIFFFSLFTSW